MAQTIQIRRGTGSAVPSSLLDGELAINLDLGQLYYGSGSTVLNDFRFKNLTAENYTVSSSVTHYTFQALSGSTDFGDDSADIHKRTGSLNVSGALSMDGDIELSNNDKIFVGSSGTEIIANNDDYWKINANGLEAARFSSAGVIINELGAAPVDFRVESDSDTHLLFVDAGANKMAIGTDTVSDSLLTIDGGVKVTHITASVISASGNLTAALINSHGHNIGFFDGTDINLGYENNTPIQIGKVGNPTTIIGHITASGNISASGTITANSIVGTVGTAAQGTIDHDSLANFVANEHIDHSGVSITAGAGLTGGGTIAATRDIAIGAGTGVTVNANDVAIGQDVATTANVLFNNITASGNISSSGDIYSSRYYANEQLALNNVNGAITLGYDNTYPINIGKTTNPIGIYGNITASSNISASGNIYSNEYYTDGYSSLNTSGTQGRVFSAAAITGIQIGRNGTPNKNIELLGPVTASGNISSSGTVTANSIVGTLATAAQANITSVGTLGSLTVTGNITANGNIVGDDGTSITNIAQIELDNLYFDGDGTTGFELGANDIHAVNSDGNTLLRLQNSLIEVGNPDATIANGIKLAYNVTASSNISASGTVTANSFIETSRTIVKILPTDFVPNDGGRPVMIEDDSIGSNELFLFSQGSFDMYAYIEIPAGYTATHVKIFGSDTSQNFTTYEGNTNSKTIAVKGSATAIGTEKDITDVACTTTNYLVILVSSDGSDDEIYGGYVKIIPS